jgi:hypothetical protein
MAFIMTNSTSHDKVVVVPAPTWRLPVRVSGRLRLWNFSISMAPERLGQSDVSATIVHSQVMNGGSGAVMSPLDRLAQKSGFDRVPGAPSIDR